MVAKRPCPIATRTTPERKQELELLRQQLGLETMSALIDLALEELMERSENDGVNTEEGRELIRQAIRYFKQRNDAQMG